MNKVLPGVNSGGNQVDKQGQTSALLDKGSKMNFGGAYFQVRDYSHTSSDCAFVFCLLGVYMCTYACMCVCARARLCVSVRVTTMIKCGT